MTDSILQTEGLTKRYGRRIVVDSLSLSVERGDIFGFLGQNGAGKSTVIRMILGLVRPTRGRVSLFGFSMATQSLRALGHVGAIVESPAFYENFSGWDNLRIFAALSGGVTRKQIEKALVLVNLLDRAQRSSWHLLPRHAAETGDRAGTFAKSQPHHSRRAHGWA